MNDRDIAEYLIAHPDFFERHAELLAGVRLTSPHGQRAVSLQERQIEMQREKTKQIERRLAELMRYGHENDDISAKLHRWTLGLLGERRTGAAGLHALLAMGGGTDLRGPPLQLARRAVGGDLHGDRCRFVH